MTLIVIAPTRDGSVMVADKRTTDPITGDRRDEETKILALSPTSCMALSGSRSHTAFGLTIFDAGVVVQRYFAERRFDDSVAFWDGLFGRFADEYGTLAQMYGRQPARANSLVFKLHMIHVADDKIRRSQFALHRDEFEKEFQLRHILDHKVHSNMFELCGDGLDVAQDMLRNDDPLMRRWVKAKTSEISIDDALAYGRRLVELTHEAQGTIGSVGREVDAAALRFNGGFSWLNARPTP